MRIPVFVSCPTSLSPSQEAARTVIIQQLDDNDLEARALGRSDYPTELPLRDVLLIARHCSDGVILGPNIAHFSTSVCSRASTIGVTKRVACTIRDKREADVRM
jgi:hypothetical protein